MAHHHLCPLMGPSVATATGTNDVQATPPGQCIYSRDPEHGPLRVHVCNLHWEKHRSLGQGALLRQFPLNLYQVCPAASPTTRSNSPPVFVELTALPFSTQVSKTFVLRPVTTGLNTNTITVSIGFYPVKLDVYSLRLFNAVGVNSLYTNINRIKLFSFPTFLKV